MKWNKYCWVLRLENETFQITFCCLMLENNKTADCQLSYTFERAALSLRQHV